jgi:hypothetical protein
MALDQLRRRIDHRPERAGMPLAAVAALAEQGLPQEEGDG